MSLITLKPHQQIRKFAKASKKTVVLWGLLRLNYKTRRNRYTFGNFTPLKKNETLVEKG